MKYSSYSLTFLLCFLLAFINPVYSQDNLEAQLDGDADISGLEDELDLNESETSFSTTNSNASSSTSETIDDLDLDDELDVVMEDERGKKKLGTKDTQNAVNELDGYEDLFPEEANSKAKSLDNNSDLLVPSELDEIDKALEENPEQKKAESTLLDETGVDLDLSEDEELDDLEALKKDLGEVFFSDERTKSDPAKKFRKEKPEFNLDLTDDEVVNSEKTEAKGIVKVFDVGKEEKQLLEVSKFVENKIPEKEWGEIAGATKTEKYEIETGDYLWKISKKLFGSGFYYSKIWALNPYITNPHQVEPGMVLLFDTGSESELPKIKVGGFDDSTELDVKIREGKGQLDLSNFGDDIKVDWLSERANIIKSGAHITSASDETYNDILEVSNQALKKEYEKYTPPIPNIMGEPISSDEYDEVGFDKNSKIQFDFKEGFFLNTFLSSNFVQDLGEIESAKNFNTLIGLHDIVYLKFDSSVSVAPGDLFTVYTPQGKVSHRLSDRSGYKYTVVAQVRTIKKIDDVWEAKIFENSGLVQRGDRVTSYTPKINRIIKTFNRRNIEAVIMSTFGGNSMVANGDVVYLDRGRADGVEIGNVFEVYSFKDRATMKRISIDPSYKVGELTVISISDNFATALSTNSSLDFEVGHIALSKTIAQAARDTRVKKRQTLQGVKDAENMALEELDVELKLDDINENLLDRADKLELSEDELEELERQERDKSIIKEHERDLKELEKLESEIEQAEALLNEAKIDEDKYLEDQDLNKIEQELKEPDPNAIESLDELERDMGRKFMDEDLNSKENPYGLTEFDLEEIDELLNEEKM